MRPLSELSYLGQVRRLRGLAENALAQYRLAAPQGAPRLKLLQHAENTTYRVDLPVDSVRENEGDLYVSGRYLLRVHRIGFHSADELRSELAWLAALRRDLGLPVPEPVRTPGGEVLVTAETRGSGERRHCSLLRWMSGRLAYRNPRPQHLAEVGKLMARLHQHARTWTPPAGFTRGRWDWEGLFGAQSGWHAEPEVVWGLLPEALRGDCLEVAERTRQAMDQMDSRPDSMGLLHADLHLGNVLFRKGEARVIDFDDCGYGHWVYDLATALAYNVDEPGYQEMEQTLLAGYSSVASLPEGQIAYLHLFIAARYVSILLWASDMAQVKPNIAASLVGWRDGMHSEVQAYLRAERWAAR